MSNPLQASRFQKSFAAPAVNEVYRVSLRPDWGEVERLRDFVALWIFALARNVAIRDAVAMATSELLENAIRHGSKDQAIEYELKLDQTSARIRVVNAITPAEDKAAQLTERVTWIATCENHLAAYSQQLKRVSEGTAYGLGLVRVAYEGNAVLSGEILPGNRVAVEATFALAGSAPRA